MARLASEQHRDEEILHLFDGLDEDTEGELLEWVTDESTVANHPDASLDAAVTSRIQRATFAKLGLEENHDVQQAKAPNSQEGRPEMWPEKRHQRRKTVGFGIAAAVLVLGVLAISPGPVSAALQKMIEFIPGIGTMPPSNQATSEGEGVAVLQQPAHGTWNGSPVTVMGVMVTPTQILVRLNGNGMSPPKEVSFQTGKGQTFHLSSYGAMSIGGTDTHPSEWGGDYSTNGDFGPVGSILSGIIVIGTTGSGTTGNEVATKIPVQLHVASGVTDLSQLGPTDSHQGVTITTVASRDGQNVNLTLAYQYQGPYHIWDFAPPMYSSGNTSKSELGIGVTDSMGTKYSVSKVLTMSPGGQFTFKAAPGQTDFHVTIPQVDATYNGDAYVRVPIPATGSEPFHKTVNLAGFPITFTKVELVNEPKGSSSLRMYFDLHANVMEPKELHAFQISKAPWQARIDAVTGAYQWMEFPVKPGQKSIRLKLTDPQVYIRGPWTFDVHVDRKSVV